MHKDICIHTRVYKYTHIYISADPQVGGGVSEDPFPLPPTPPLTYLFYFGWSKTRPPSRSQRSHHFHPCSWPHGPMTPLPQAPRGRKRGKYRVFCVLHEKLLKNSSLWLPCMHAAPNLGESMLFSRKPWFRRVFGRVSRLSAPTPSR